MAFLLFLLLAVSYYILASNATGTQDIMNLIYTVCIYRICACSTVTLDSPADSVCPGDTVVFTCATDTGELIWDIDGNNLVSLNDAQRQQSLSIFELNLTSSAGNNFVSTATVRDVHLDHNGTRISCMDKNNPFLSDEEFETVILSGNMQALTVISILHAYAGPPSPPLNLMVASSTLSSVTISWVASVTETHPSDVTSADAH